MGQRQGESREEERGERAWEEVHILNPSSWEVGAGTGVRFLSKEGKKRRSERRVPGSRKE